MSTALAIAATTTVIRGFLQAGISAANLGGLLGDITVSALPPDRITTGAAEGSQLNLFMYQVSPNPGWRNVELASRRPSGDRLSSPPLALDLHYVLSAFGGGDLHPEILLGHAMQLLHEMPVLTREAIRAAFTPNGGPLEPLVALLATAGLDDQEELIKVTPQTLTADEISKLWSVFGEKYRPTAAYLATVVLIRSRRSTTSAPPVRETRVYTRVIGHPVIESVEPQVADPDTDLTLHGHGLAGPNTVVRFSNGSSGIVAAGANAERLDVRPPADLRAGVSTVQVIQDIAFDSPPLRRGFDSNVVAFVLRPAIATRTVAGSAEPAIDVGSVDGSGSQPRSGTITVELVPAVGRRQRAAILLNESGAPVDRAPRAYAFDATSRQADASETSDTLEFPFRGVTAGTYLLRVRVDGAETSLEVGADGRYSGPQAVVP
jgi:hypothetical protein